MMRCLRAESSVPPTVLSSCLIFSHYLPVASPLGGLDDALLESGVVGLLEIAGFLGLLLLVPITVCQLGTSTPLTCHLVRGER